MATNTAPTDIMYADACELPLPTTSTTEGILAPDAGSGATGAGKTAIATRDTTSFKLQDYHYGGLIDANGEGCDYRSIMHPTSSSAISLERQYWQSRIAFSDGTPATASNRLGIIEGSTFFNNWIFRIGTDGICDLFNSGTPPVLQASGSLVFANDQSYWRLVDFDATNGVINQYLGAASANFEGLLDQATWVTPDLTHTDATQNGTISNFTVGFNASGVNNPATTFRLESVVITNSKPTIPRSVYYLNVGSNGYYSSTGGGGTVWTDNGTAGDFADYTSVDDPVSANADGDTTYLNCARLEAAGSRVSMTLATNVGVIPAYMKVLAVVPIIYWKRTTNDADTTGLRAFLRYNSTDMDTLDAGTAGTLNTYNSSNVGAVAEVYEAAPDGTAWTLDKLLTTEIGATRIGTSTGGTKDHHITRMGAYVVCEPHPSLVRPNRASMRALGIR